MPCWPRELNNDDGFFQGLKEISSEWTKEIPQIDLKSHFDCKERLSRNDDSVQHVIEYEDCSIHSCSQYHDVALLWLVKVFNPNL